MENVNYQIIDNMCEAALIDLNYHEDQNTWLHEHKFFFEYNLHHLNEVVFNQENEGKDFPNILKFFFTFTKISGNK